jgi:hypothetical protein
MTSIQPLLAVSALIGVSLIPLALVWGRPATGKAVAVGYAALLATLTGYHVALFAGPSLPDLDVSETARPAVADAQCAELLEVLERNQVILDRSEPPHLIVASSLWATLPEVAKSAVGDCVQRDWPADADPIQIHVQPR